MTSRIFAPYLIVSHGVVNYQRRLSESYSRKSQLFRWILSPCNAFRRTLNAMLRLYVVSSRICRKEGWAEILQKVFWNTSIPRYAYFKAQYTDTDTHLSFMQRDILEIPPQKRRKIIPNTDTDSERNTFVPERCCVGRINANGDSRRMQMLNYALFLSHFMHFPLFLTLYLSLTPIRKHVTPGEPRCY